MVAEKELVGKLEREVRARKALLNKVIELQGNIRVYCRVRPFSENEKQSAAADPNAAQSVVSFPAENTVCIAPSAGAAGENFEFDRVFDQKSTQGTCCCLAWLRQSIEKRVLIAVVCCGVNRGRVCRGRTTRAVVFGWIQRLYLCVRPNR
jgi:hypothetical protein